MKNILIVILLSVLFYGCTESTNPLNPIPDTSPIWPMPGYNARNTSSPYAPDAIMNPVANGTLGWLYTFPSGSYSDGSEFCVDSRGFIYYLHQIYPLGALYKFSPDGQVVWKRDSLIQWNFAAISLSRDESQIYFVAFKPGIWDRLYCLDSAGKDMWHQDSALVTKPAIGKDGTIYSFHWNGLIAVSPDGSILWTNTSVKGNAAQNYIALDREDNIYTVSYPGNYVKVSKQGDVKWEFTAVNNLFGIVIDGYGNLYFNGFSDDKFYCLNNSGQIKWTKLNINAYTAPVITSDNRIIVSTGGYVISYDTAGTEVWRCQPFTNLTGAEGLLLDDADNVYYIGDGNYILAGSISSTGSKRWEVSTVMSGSLPPPVLLPQGRMVVAPKRAGRIQAVN
ncbi:MAG: PQQ-binding-like beta-propeller repeat protein [Candidatus Kapaibacterium sp.]